MHGCGASRDRARQSGGAPHSIEPFHLLAQRVSWANTQDPSSPASPLGLLVVYSVSDSPSHICLFLRASPHKATLTRELTQVPVKDKTLKSASRRRMGTAWPGSHGRSHASCPQLYDTLFILHPKASFHILFLMVLLYVHFLLLWSPGIAEDKLARGMPEVTFSEKKVGLVSAFLVSSPNWESRSLGV